MRAILYPLLLLVPFMTSCATGLNSGATPEIQKHDPDAAFAQDFAAFTKELEVATPTLTGLSAVVVRENGVIAATNFGMADVGEQRRCVATDAVVHRFFDQGICWRRHRPAC